MANEVQNEIIAERFGKHEFPPDVISNRMLVIKSGFRNSTQSLDALLRQAYGQAMSTYEERNNPHG